MNNDFLNWFNYEYYKSNFAPQMFNSNPKYPDFDLKNLNFKLQDLNFYYQNSDFDSQNFNFRLPHYHMHPMNVLGDPYGYHFNYYQG